MPFTQDLGAISKDTRKSIQSSIVVISRQRKLSISWDWSIFLLLPERKVLAPAHLLYYIWDKQRGTLCWIHQRWLDSSMEICTGLFCALLQCVLFYVHAFETFSTAPLLEIQTQICCSSNQYVVHFRSSPCFFPLRLIDQNYVKLVLLQLFHHQECGSAIIWMQAFLVIYFPLHIRSCRLL